MKKIIIACFLLLSLATCKQQPANPPTVVLEDMFTAMRNGNFEEMKKSITKSDVAMLEAAEKFMTGIDPEGIQKIKSRMTEELKKQAQHIEYRLTNEKIEGDRATVEAEIVTKDSAALNGKKTSKQTFELVKEDNTWKIALSKPGNQLFNSMKGNMGARKGDLKDGLEKLQKMNQDTLKMFIKKGLQALDSMQKKKE